MKIYLLCISIMIYSMCSFAHEAGDGNWHSQDSLSFIPGPGHPMVGYIRLTNPNVRQEGSVHLHVYGDDGRHQQIGLSGLTGDVSDVLPANSSTRLIPVQRVITAARYEFGDYRGHLRITADANFGDVVINGVMLPRNGSTFTPLNRQ